MFNFVSFSLLLLEMIWGEFGKEKEILKIYSTTDLEIKRF